MSLSQRASRLSAAAVMLVVGCGITGTEECVPGISGNPAMLIMVMDGLTGEPIAQGATGTVREGEFVAELEEVPPDDFGPVAALGLYPLREGQYEVTIRRDGYDTWAQTVTVEALDECGFARPVVEVSAELTPISD